MAIVKCIYCRAMPVVCLFILSSCSVSNKVSRLARETITTDSSLKSGHVGISIYDPATGKYLYQLNADKYFIPGSTVKLFTFYTALKHLGDSIPAMRIRETGDSLFLSPTGDPTFLHPDFRQQPVLEALAKSDKKLAGVDDRRFKTSAYGSGWSWDDYNESFMNERSAFPVFGNVVSLSGTADKLSYFPKVGMNLKIPVTNKRSYHLTTVDREQYENVFNLHFEGDKESQIVIPFITSLPLAFKLLADTLHKNIAPPVSNIFNQSGKNYIIYSRHADSLYKPMISNSDNFFAEQALLMSSNAFLGYMNEADMIDTVLNSDLKDIPHRPRWVDGSGLSRYNLFTPKSFIYMLQKLQDAAGIERLKVIFPTGGEGTLKNYFHDEAGNIFAKTGSLSNNSSLCGFMYTKKGRMLVFAVMANNYPSSTTYARRAMEKFLQRIWKEY